MLIQLALLRSVVLVWHIYILSVRLHRVNVRYLLYR
jgi:hypothetical protein